MGKNKYIETPEKLAELFDEYREYKRENPRIIEKALQSGKIGKEKMRVPLTMSGFRVFCHKKGITVVHYFSNTDNAYKEYRTICRIIEDEIREDQIEGGMVGQYNSSITQRLNGLTEKTDVTSDGQSLSKIEIEVVRSGSNKEQ